MLTPDRPAAATQEIIIKRPRADNRVVKFGIVIEKGKLTNEKTEAKIPEAFLDRPVCRAKVGSQVIAV